ncbi:MAG TPA: hypothetical protein PKC18_15420 [Lacipirellulaceae bacterium]|nr:hypothetical protein [Lacipirellulaceae bacterium]HMP08060.1 hypothetical protein [Lacipirellulaceae bacterium]
MALASITLLCTQADVERHLSVYGVRLRLDDDGDGHVDSAELAAMTDARTEASETCYFYLGQKYSEEMLATSNWVNRKAMILACYRICTRRANPCPDSLAEDAAKVEEELKSVADGPRLIPGLPLRRILAPTWSFTKADPRYQFRVIRVEKNNSSQHNPTRLKQNVDYVEAFTYEI